MDIGAVASHYVVGYEREEQDTEAETSRYSPVDKVAVDIEAAVANLCPAMDSPVLRDRERKIHLSSRQEQVCWYLWERHRPTK